MSYPYPQDGHRDRKDKGEQPYKHDHEAMSQKDSEQRASAEQSSDAPSRGSDEERLDRLSTEAGHRLKWFRDKPADPAF